MFKHIDKSEERDSTRNKQFYQKPRKISENHNFYKINEFAKRIGKSTSTLRRWDTEGRLVAKRTPTGHRYYDESDVRKIFGIKDIEKKVVVYCRVSSHNQKEDLQSQVIAMEQFCLNSGISVDEWIQEIGGGMNFKRKSFCL